MMSVGDQSAMREPRRGRCSTRPCCVSSRSASRSGALLMPKSAQLFLDDLLPGLQIAAEDGVAQPTPDDFDQRCGQRVSRTVMPWSNHGRQW
jgi:hypothetical protein